MNNILLSMQHMQATLVHLNRFYAGRDGYCLVRYDNERGKGDHRHYGEREEPYSFRSLEQLIEDFIADVERLEVDHGQ